MLVLSRKVGERIIIEPGIEISVVDVRAGRVRIGIVAPAHVGIRRTEVEPRVGNLAQSTPHAVEQY
ncbi:MAG: carbon storage regulator [Planctomycetaceae bacterium]|nr:carbon storage regulator [Planctomycetaceae bacterium]